MMAFPLAPKDDCSGKGELQDAGTGEEKQTKGDIHAKCRDRNMFGMTKECVWESKSFLKITGS